MFVLHSLDQKLLDACDIKRYPRRCGAKVSANVDGGQRQSGSIVSEATVSPILDASRPVHQRQELFTTPHLLDSKHETHAEIVLNCTTKLVRMVSLVGDEALKHYQCRLTF